MITRRRRSSPSGCKARLESARRAQKYFTIEVVNHPDRPEAPLELRYRVDRERVQQDAELDGVYLLVAGGKAATLSDGDILAEWKGQHKVERCFRLVNQFFLVAPLFVKTPRRIAALVFLIMVGALVARLIERQVRRVVAWVLMKRKAARITARAREI